MFAKAIVLAAAATSALAVPIVDLAARQTDHSNIDLGKYAKVGFVYPKPRGWVNETDQVAPCGGLPAGERTEWPLTGGKFSLLMADEAYTVQFSYAALADPKSDGDFQPLMQSFTGGDQIGHSCFNTPDFSALGMKVGDSVTVQVEYLGGGSDTTPYYQCADLKIVPTEQYNPAKFTCINAMTSVDDFTSDQKATVAVKSDMDPVRAGAIGAGVSLGAVVIFFGLLSALGLVAFGRKQKAPAAVNSAVRSDDQSSRHSTSKF